MAVRASRQSSMKSRIVQATTSSAGRTPQEMAPAMAPSTAPRSEEKRDSTSPVCARA
jgi:hypothetical protein